MPDQPKRKRSRSQSGGFDSREDLNYVDDDSDLSSGDEVLASSDLDVPLETQGRKRGRPKSYPKEESRNKYIIDPLSQQNYVYESDIDESGEEKVDKAGRLLGGREYKVPTFKLPTRGDTLFMFSKDPAALLGFRDSFVFLKKNIKLVKVQIDNLEKGILVDSNLLRSTFRTREISVVTARSVFKQFGHRVVKKGKKGIDDYYYSDQVDDDRIDEGSDNEQLLQSQFEEKLAKEMIDNKIISNTTTPAYLPVMNEVGRHNLSHKHTQNINNNEINWMYQAALSTRQFNSSIFTYRLSNPTSYDLLSNVYQIPESKQSLLDTTLFEKSNTPNISNLNNSNLDLLTQTEIDSS